MMSLFISVIIVAVVLIVYFKWYRPWQIRWGATDNEISTNLSGDDIVSHPDFNATRGITINGQPEEVWKWIIQIGSKRAGWYSIDWIDNGGVPSSEKILSQFQLIEQDQFIPFTPNQKNGMWVKEFQPNQYILWWDKKGEATWLWYLIPVDSKTRLLTRLRTKYKWSGLWIIYYLIADAGDIVMMSKCMKGIKRRAEASAP